MAAPLRSSRLSGVNVAFSLDTPCVCSLCLHRCCPPVQGRAPHQLWPLDPRLHHGSGPPAPSKRSRGLFGSCLARPHPLPRHPYLHQHPHCLRPGTQGPLQLSLAVRNPPFLCRVLAWGGGRIPSSLSVLTAEAEVSCSAFWTLDPQVRSPSFHGPPRACLTPRDCHPQGVVLSVDLEAPSGIQRPG